MKTADPLDQYRNIIDLLLDAICVVDPLGRFVFVSAACERIFGYTPDEMIGRRSIDMVHPDDRAATLRVVDELHAGTDQFAFENRYVRKDGTIAHIMWSARWSESNNCRIAVARDISEQKRAQARQKAIYAISDAVRSSEDLSSVFKRVLGALDALLPVRTFYIALGDTKDGRLHFDFFVDRLDSRSKAPPPDCIELTNAVIQRGEPMLVRLDRRQRAHPSAAVGDGCDWLGIPLCCDGSAIGVLVVQNRVGDAPYTEQDQTLMHHAADQIADVIARNQAQARLQFMAQHDPLTGLPNRTLFMDRLQTALARARRENSLIAVMFLDMDSFKQINDRHGHLVGDQLLRAVAMRLKDSIRASDTVGRLGGDEFVVVLERVSSPACVATIADNFRTALSAPIDLDGTVLQVTSSIGIAMYPMDGDNDRQLIRCADDAMYVAKNAGGNRTHFSQVASSTPS